MNNEELKKLAIEIDKNYEEENKLHEKYLEQREILREKRNKLTNKLHGLK